MFQYLFNIPNNASTTADFTNHHSAMMINDLLQSLDPSLVVPGTGLPITSSSTNSQVITAPNSTANISGSLQIGGQNGDGGGGSSADQKPKKYRCDLCGLGLSAFGSIKRHKDAVHFGIRKKFAEKECPICKKSYFQLQKHIKIKHKDSKLKCTICDRVLSCSFSYKRHMKKVHGKIGSEQPLPLSVPNSTPTTASQRSKKNKNNTNYQNQPQQQQPSSSNNQQQQSHLQEPPHQHSQQQQQSHYNNKLPQGIGGGGYDNTPNMFGSRMPDASPHNFHPFVPGMIQYPPPFTPYKRPEYNVPGAMLPVHGSHSSTKLEHHNQWGSQYGATGFNPVVNQSLMYQYPMYTAGFDSQAPSTSIKQETKDFSRNSVANFSNASNNNNASSGGGGGGNNTNANTGSSSSNNATGSSSSSGGNTNLPTISNICVFCNASFKDTSSARRHMRSMHAKKYQEMEAARQGTKQYKCSLCPITLSCSGSIHRHMRLMHNKKGENGRELPEYPFPCQVCERSFPTEMSLQRHASYHKKAGEMPGESNSSTFSTCAPCDRGFENNWSYEKHMLQHPDPNTPITQPGKVCSACNIVVTSSMSLKRHKK